MPTNAVPDLVSPYEPSFGARVGMADGTELATDVYLPSARAPAGHPVALVRTPYGRRGEIDAVPETAQLLNEAGIAVVAQDVRGKFDSDGERLPFAHEATDGRDTLEWIAEQPWSGGAVVPLGASYTGFTAWAAAATRHPSLRGVVVRATTCHIGSEWLYRQGLFRLQMNGQWALFAWGGAGLQPFEPDWRGGSLADIVAGAADDSHLRHWLRHPPESPWWAQHGLTAPATLSRRVQVPVLHWSGWWDLLARGQLRDHALLAGAPGAADQRLIMGATDHDFHPYADAAAGTLPPLSRPLRRPGVNVDFGPAMDFVRTVLRGERPGSGVRWELTHDGWHTSPAWPPPAHHLVRMHLADGAHAGYGPEGGALAHRPDSVPMTAGWTHDPADPVPSLEQFVWGTLAHDYPDERDAQIRDDVLTFSGQPAVEPLDIVGPVRVRLRAQASTPEAQLAVALCDVHPDGRTLRIVEGSCLVRDAGEWQDVDVDLGPTAFRLQPDHRLRLSIAGSAFPRYLGPAGPGRDPWCDGPGPPFEQRIQLRGSHLELPVLD
jgi:putative CocE/NonD family hydrolase